MINLFIDTSSNRIVLAIVENNNVLSCINEKNDTTLSDRIFPLIMQLFTDANKNIKNISKIYVVNGPGSFTGIRVGVTIAKTIAWTLEIPVIPVSSLEVMATTKYDGDYLIPYIDARREFVFAGIYDMNLNIIVEDSHIRLSELIKKIPKNSKCSLVGYDEIKSPLSMIKPEIDLIRVIDKHKEDVGINPHTLIPNYLKLTEAEENLKKVIS
jgi:tRNA threonylcarbamoyladenosine biosynthesis protein TsaB